MAAVLSLYLLLVEVVYSKLVLTRASFTTFSTPCLSLTKDAASIPSILYLPFLTCG